jgi:hypothetical protein
MAIDASGWCDNFYIWWTDESCKFLTDEEYRVKLMDGGALLFEPGAFNVVAPHTWITK